MSGHLRVDTNPTPPETPSANIEAFVAAVVPAAALDESDFVLGGNWRFPLADIPEGASDEQILRAMQTLDLGGCA